MMKSSDGRGPDRAQRRNDLSWIPIPPVQFSHQTRGVWIWKSNRSLMFIPDLKLHTQQNDLPKPGVLPRAQLALLFLLLFAAFSPADPQRWRVFFIKVWHKGKCVWSSCVLRCSSRWNKKMKQASNYSQTHHLSHIETREANRWWHTTQNSALQKTLNADKSGCFLWWAHFVCVSLNCLSPTFLWSLLLRYGK